MARYHDAVSAAPKEPRQSGFSPRTKWIVGCSVAALVAGVIGIAFLMNQFACEVPPCTIKPTTPQEQASIEAAQSALLASYGGPPPAHCGAELASVHPKVPNTIWSDDPTTVYLGKAPVWLGISDSALEKGRAVVHLEHSGISKSGGGFPMYLEWVEDAGFAEDIHVKVTDQQSGAELVVEPAVYMHDPDLLVASESRVIDPVDRPYRIYTTQAIFPTSPACYLASASWPGGEWSIAIAIGL
jgi:hypothetical protein